MKIITFVDQCNWNDINFSAQQNVQEESEKPKNIMEVDWKKFEQNNETIALNISSVHATKKK